MEQAEIPTLATDGTKILYSPTFLDTLSDAQLTGVLAHEVLHCALLHPFRRGSRDAKKWNVATDYAINGELVKCGLTLPTDVLIDSQYDGLSAETIYAQLPDGDSSGDSPEPSTGTVQDAPSDSPATPSDAPSPMTESDWKVAAEQASDVARGCGKLPGGVDRKVKASRASSADWRELLREFITNTVPSDYSWSRPNRRYISRGLYLPGVVKENCGPLVIAIDTSGSISARNLAAFSSEINAILADVRPELVTVLYCDTDVRKVEEFGAEDSVTLSAFGGGGTRFSPVITHLSNMPEQPSALIYFTDLDCYESITAPDCPTLWITDQAITTQPQFGTIARIDANSL
jgi:predicted metal-dependent peptidase